MAYKMNGKFEPPKRASASHLIHLIGVENFRKELAKQQKAKASGILEVISATSIRREAPATERELMMMRVVDKMHQNKEIDDLVWSQIKALYVYLGASKDRNGAVEKHNCIFPEDWEPQQDLNFAKRLLPKFLSYQLESYKELGASIDKIIEDVSSIDKDQEAQNNLSPDEVKKAEELAYWNVIKDSEDKRDFQSFIKRFKGGVCERLAYVKMEELAWNKLGENPKHRALNKFLEEFPYGRFADTAKAQLKKLADEADAKRKNTAENPLKQDTPANLSSPLSDLKVSLEKNADKKASSFSPVSLLSKLVVGTFSFAGKALWVVLSNPRLRNASAVILFALAFTSYVMGYWSAPTRDDSIKTFVGHSKALKTAVFTPDGLNVVSGSEDQTLKLWDIETGEAVRTFKGHKDIISSVTISPDGNYLLSGSHDNTVKLWDIKSGDLLNTFESHKNWVVSVAFSSDGNYALSGSHDKTIKLWDIQKGKLRKTFKGHQDWVISVAFAAEDRAVISGSHDKTLKIWDIKSGKALRTLKGHKDWVTSVSVSGTNLTALSGSYDESIMLWNINTGKPIRTFKAKDTSAVTSVAFSPDFKAALSSSFDDKLILWDLTSGQPIRIFMGHKKSRANSVAISPDGRYALSAGQDKTLKLWRLQKKEEVSSLGSSS